MILIYVSLAILHLFSPTSCRSVKVDSEESPGQLHHLLLPLLGSKAQKDDIKVQVVPYKEYKNQKTKLSKPVAQVTPVRKDKSDVPVAIIIAEPKYKKKTAAITSRNTKPLKIKNLKRKVIKQYIESSESSTSEESNEPQSKNKDSLIIQVGKNSETSEEHEQSGEINIKETKTKHKTIHENVSLFGKGGHKDGKKPKFVHLNYSPGLQTLSSSESGLTTEESSQSSSSSEEIEHAVSRRGKGKHGKNHKHTDVESEKKSNESNEGKHASSHHKNLRSSLVESKEKHGDDHGHNNKKHHEATERKADKSKESSESSSEEDGKEQKHHKKGEESKEGHRREHKSSESSEEKQDKKLHAKSALPQSKEDSHEESSVETNVHNLEQNRKGHNTSHSHKKSAEDTRTSKTDHKFHVDHPDDEITEHKIGNPFFNESGSNSESENKEHTSVKKAAPKSGKANSSESNSEQINEIHTQKTKTLKAPSQESVELTSESKSSEVLKHAKPTEQKIHDTNTDENHEAGGKSDASVEEVHTDANRHDKHHKDSKEGKHNQHAHSKKGNHNSYELSDESVTQNISEHSPSDELSELVHTTHNRYQNSETGEIIELILDSSESGDKKASSIEKQSLDSDKSGTSEEILHQFELFTSHSKTVSFGTEERSGTDETIETHEDKHDKDLSNIVNSRSAEDILIGDNDLLHHGPLSNELREAHDESHIDQTSESKENKHDHDTTNNKHASSEESEEDKLKTNKNSLGYEENIKKKQNKEVNSKNKDKKAEDETHSSTETSEELKVIERQVLDSITNYVRKRAQSESKNDHEAKSYNLSFLFNRR